MAFSTRAPLRMTQPCMTMLLITLAPLSTTTPRERMELRTVPMISQPAEMRELQASEPEAYLAGAASWAFVRIGRSFMNSWLQTRGSSISMLRR